MSSAAEPKQPSQSDPTAPAGQSGPPGTDSPPSSPTGQFESSGPSVPSGHEAPAASVPVGPATAPSPMNPAAATGGVLALVGSALLFISIFLPVATTSSYNYVLWELFGALVPSVAISVMGILLIIYNGMYFALSSRTPRIIWSALGLMLMCVTGTVSIGLLEAYSGVIDRHSGSILPIPDHPGIGFGLLILGVVMLPIGNIIALFGNAASTAGSNRSSVGRSGPSPLQAGHTGYPPPVAWPAPSVSQPLVPTQPGPPAAESDLAGKLRELASLRDAGLITEDEFQAKRKRLLDLD